MTTEINEGYVWVQVSDELYDALVAIADQEVCSVNDLLVKALWKLVEAYE